MRFPLRVLPVILLAACSYEPRDLECDPVTSGCGVTEACALDRAGAAICSCGSTEANASRACGAQESCSEGACVANVAPTAVIQNAVDNRLRIASNSTIRLSGRGSSDPENGALEYDWELSEGCGAVGPFEGIEITVSSSGFADTCEVTLTVTDPLGEIGSTYALMVQREIGSYVWSDTSACETYVRDSDAVQGTRLTPFCTIEDGIRAANDYGLVEVYAAAETWLRDATLVVTGVTIIGGHDVTADWARTGVTRIRAENGAEPLVALRDGTTGLRYFEIEREIDCQDACALVSVEGTQAVIRDTVVTADVTVGAPALTGIEVRDTDNTTQLQISGSTITMYDGTITRGVDVRGPVRFSIQDASTITVRNPAVLGIGLRAVAAASIAIVQSSIAVDNAPTSYGVVDGRTELFASISGECAPSGSCNGSGSFLLDRSRVTAARGVFVAGAMLIGTSNVRLIGDSADPLMPNATIRASGASHVVALTTLDVTNPLDSATADAIDNVGIYAEGVGNNMDDSFTFAYQDGVIDKSIPAVAHGSHNIRFGGGTLMRASLTGTPWTGAIAAMVLNASENFTFSGGTFVTTGEGSNLAFIAGAALSYGTRNLTIRNNAAFKITGLRATSRIVSYSDGCGYAVENNANCDTNALGSRNLTISGSSFSGDLRAAAASVGVRRICVLLGGTRESSISDSSLICAGEVAQQQNDLNIWLWTFQTTDVRVEDLLQSAFDATDGGGSATTWYVGFLDGLHPTLGSSTTPAYLHTYASTRLTLDRNSIQLWTPARPSVNLVGVWYRGHINNDIHSLTNTLIDLDGDQAYGVLLDQTQADISLNTLSVARCADPTPCNKSGIGLYYLLGQSWPSRAVGNIFALEQVATPNESPHVVTHRPTGVRSGLQVLSYNEYGLSKRTTGTAPPLYATLDSNDPRPQPAGLASSAGNIADTLATGSSNINNVATEPVFCGPLEFVQNTTAGNNLVPTSAITSTRLVDYAGHTRLTPYDAGATERGTEQCIVPID